MPSTQQTPSSLTSLTLVEGLLPASAPTAEVQHLRQRFRQHLDQGFGARLEEAAQGETPFISGAGAYAAEFAPTSRVIGERHLATSGARILGVAHPVPSVEMAVLIAHLARRVPSVELAILISMRTISSLVPMWRDRVRNDMRVLEVEFIHEPDGRVHAANGAAVMAAAASWIQTHADGILIIAPEGQTVMWRNGVGVPLRGLGELAASTGAAVIPVVTTGKVNLETFRFDLTVECLPPLKPERDPRVVGENWRRAIIEGAGRSALTGGVP